MVAYILDSMDLSIKDIIQFNSYTLNEDIDYTNKGSLEASRQPNITDDDFVLLKMMITRCFLLESVILAIMVARL